MRADSISNIRPKDNATATCDTHPKDLNFAALFWTLRDEYVIPLIMTLVQKKSGNNFNCFLYTFQSVRSVLIHEDLCCLTCRLPSDNVGVISG
jgi:hypothetical protein